MWHVKFVARLYYLHFHVCCSFNRKNWGLSIRKRREKKRLRLYLLLSLTVVEASNKKEFQDKFYFPQICGLCLPLSFPRKFVAVSLFAVVSTEEILFVTDFFFFNFFSSGRRFLYICY